MIQQNMIIMNILIKILKKAILLIAMLIAISSCKEKTSYQMQLLIDNKTNNKITVRLFPKSEYLHNDLYDFSDFGGGYNVTIFEIEPNQDGNLYYSDNLDQTPFDLASKIFDSIHLTPFNED